jgi:hypothetical protein
MAAMASLPEEEGKGKRGEGQGVQMLAVEWSKRGRHGGWKGAHGSAESSLVPAPVCLLFYCVR